MWFRPTNKQCNPAQRISCLIVSLAQWRLRIFTRKDCWIFQNDIMLQKKLFVTFFLRPACLRSTCLEVRGTLPRICPLTINAGRLSGKSANENAWINLTETNCWFSWLTRTMQPVVHTSAHPPPPPHSFLPFPLSENALLLFLPFCPPRWTHLQPLQDEQNKLSWNCPFTSLSLP